MNARELSGPRSEFLERSHPRDMGTLDALRVNEMTVEQSGVQAFPGEVFVFKSKQGCRSSVRLSKLRGK